MLLQTDPTTLATYRDKVYGCWVGKACGGTLGTPLEKPYGEPDPFDVWWYPELPEGGLPNDDLEMQLIWLKALEEVGPSLTSDDLARYWLTNVGYNFDEYGLSKANLRLGLRPPVSGNFNNWFRDAMGCPIRSEIWACVTPGSPRVAARLAFEDAICDHAGGESVFGELFNATVQSAAFVASDRDELIDIGLSYIPASSATARAILAAREAHAAGRPWIDARAAVMTATPHYNAQYSPINLGFQIVGWLYGNDFGDALCKAVNCGYDTDCTGATLGATLGIIYGRGGLPAKWIDPVGDAIPTNESWGGMRHLADGPNPAPKTLAELTDRVAAVAVRMSSTFGVGSDGTFDRSELLAPEDIADLWHRSPTATRHRAGPLAVTIDFGTTPAIRPNESKTINITLANNLADPIKLHMNLAGPMVAIVDVPDVDLQPGVSQRVDVVVQAPPAGRLQNSNILQLGFDMPGWPAVETVPVVLIGARRYRVAGPYPIPSDSATPLDFVFPPEVLDGPAEEQDSRLADWGEVSSYGHDLPVDALVQSPGVAYIQGFLHVERPRRARVGVSSNCHTRTWVNSRLVVDAEPHLVRPSYEGHGQQYADTDLSAGWNEVLIKIVRHPEASPFEGYLAVSDADNLFAGMWEARWTQLPWDAS